MSRMLVKRYLSFIEMIEKSGKTSLKQLLDIVRKDVRTVTGHNLRSIMLLAGVNRIDNLNPTTDFEYHKLGGEEEWKTNLKVNGKEADELQQILYYVCTG